MKYVIYQRKQLEGGGEGGYIDLLYTRKKRFL